MINVRDGRHGYIGFWNVMPLVYDELGPEDVGRTVIYQDVGRREAGTLTSWRNGIVFAKYSRGDTAAGADPKYLMFGSNVEPTRPWVDPRSGDERLIADMAAHSAPCADVMRLLETGA